MEKMLDAKNEIREIALSDLLTETMKMKNDGRRLSQICAAYRDDKYELSYSFADDNSLDYTSLRVIVGLEDEVPSICEFFPYSDFYENEMKELFGVKMRMMKRDYHDRLYRIEAKTPFLPEEAKAKKAPAPAAEVVSQAVPVEITTSPATEEDKEEIG